MIAMRMHKLRWIVVFGLLGAWAESLATAGEAHNSLPEDHAYQRTLRAWLGSLAEGDYALDPLRFSVPADYEKQADTILLTYMALALNIQIEFNPLLKPKTN